MIYLTAHELFQTWLPPLDTLLCRQSHTIQRYQRDTPLMEADLVLYIGHLADDEASQLNTVCHAAGSRLLFAAPAGKLFQAGPLIVYDQAPCVACYREWHSVQPANGFQYQSQSIDPESVQYTPDAVNGLGMYLADVLDALMQSQRDPVFPPGYILYLNPADGVEQYRIRAAKAGTCPVCSPWTTHAAESYITLQKRSS